MKRSPTPVLLGGAVLVVIAAVLTGLFVLGSPSAERARRLDQRRVRDLQEIRAAADLYRARHDRVPASLDELTAEPGVRISPRDPESSQLYDFQPLDSVRYELCATFSGESELLPRNPEGAFWAHGAGRQCFRVEAPVRQPGER